MIDSAFKGYSVFCDLTNVRFVIRVYFESLVGIFDNLWDIHNLVMYAACVIMV